MGDEDQDDLEYNITFPAGKFRCIKFGCDL